MSRVLIIGGHGKVALFLAPMLSERGDEVTSVFRNPDHTADVAATGATPVVADIERLSEQDIAQLLRGQDAVVWSAGAGGGNPQRTYAVDRDAAVRTIDAASEAGGSRFIMVSYLGAGQDHGVPEENPFYAYAQAKADADDHLRSSALDWTILGPGRLTMDDPTGRIEVISKTDSGDNPTARANVALVVAAALREPSTIGRTIDFRDGDTPIAQAIAG